LGRWQAEKVAEEHGLSATCQYAIIQWGEVNDRISTWPCYFKAEVVSKCEALLEHGESIIPAWEERMDNLYKSPEEVRHREEAKQIRDWMAMQGLIEDTHPIGLERWG
jgi:hypothetical protein